MGPAGLPGAWSLDNFYGAGGQHLGLLEGCGGGLPFTVEGDGQTATCC